MPAAFFFSPLPCSCSAFFFFFLFFRLTWPLSRWTPAGALSPARSSGSTPASCGKRCGRKGVRDALRCCTHLSIYGRARRTSKRDCSTFLCTKHLPAANVRLFRLAAVWFAASAKELLWTCFCALGAPHSLHSSVPTDRFVLGDLRAHNRGRCKNRTPSCLIS